MRAAGAAGSRARHSIAAAVAFTFVTFVIDRSAISAAFDRSAEVAVASDRRRHDNNGGTRLPTSGRSAAAEDQNVEDRRENDIVRHEHVFRKTRTGRVPVAVQNQTALHHVGRAAAVVTTIAAGQTIDVLLLHHNCIISFYITMGAGFEWPENHLKTI